MNPHFHRGSKDESLSTRTERYCPACYGEFVMADPTMVLAPRPAKVELLCSGCSRRVAAVLTSNHAFLFVVGLRGELLSENPRLAMRMSSFPPDSF